MINCAAGPGQTPIAFVEIAQRLVSLVVTETLSGRPLAWCRSLINSGVSAELVNLDATSRANLGIEVEKLIRVVCIVESQGESGKDDDQQLDTLQKDLWMDASLVRSGMVNLMDMAHVLQADANALQRRNFTKTREALTCAYSKTVDQICGDLKKAKEELRPWVLELVPIFDALCEGELEAKKEVALEFEKPFKDTENSRAKVAMEGPSLHELVSLLLCLCD